MTEVIFPRLSEREPDSEGVVASWFVTDGQQVADGQLLGEVMVEKVSAEITAPAAGRIHLVVGEDQAARQDQVIARIE